VIAALGSTQVTITPSTTTSAQHPGAISGAGSDGQPHPYSVNLSRGQSVTVYSAGDDGSTDISGTTITATRPVAVISAHEDGFTLDGSMNGFSVDGRDLMIEQLLPVECFDTTGYATIPFFEGSGTVDGGSGDEIRCVSADGVTMSVQDLSGNSSLTIQPYSPAVRTSVTTPKAFTASKPFGVMMYDQRMQPGTAPFPAPSMMSIVPLSRWKNDYSFEVPAQSYDEIFNSYILVVSVNHAWTNGLLKVSYNGAAFTSPQSAGCILKRSYNSVPSTSYLTGDVIALAPGSYHFIGGGPLFESDTVYPFMIYNYGMREFALDDDLDDDSYFSEYANPCGMTYGEFGVPKPDITAVVENHCDHWTVCVTDNTSPKNSIRYIEVVNYPRYDLPEYSYHGISRPQQAYNLRLDPAYDELGKGEIFFDGQVQHVCLDVSKADPTDSAFGTIAIYDNSGAVIFVKLPLIQEQDVVGSGTIGRTAHNLFDFANTVVGTTNCGVVVIKDTSSHQNAISVNGVSLNGDTSHIRLNGKVGPATVSFRSPDSIAMCFTPTDTGTTQASLVINALCDSNFLYQVRGRGVSGIIQASDIDFGTVTGGSEYCRLVSIKNTGTYPFVLYGFTLSDTVNFRIDSSTSPLRMPVTVDAGRTIQLNVCARPKTSGSFSAKIDWHTNISHLLDAKVKAYSLLSAGATSSVADDEQQNEIQAYIRGDAISVTLPNDQGGQYRAELYDIIGRRITGWNNITSNPLPLPVIAAGVYIVRIISSDERVTSVQVIKK
jgi:hypothetical protein